jgi:pimeloyl-ACP methyl ester carboxylesterase
MWFVLVPGACHGGWWFEPLAQELRELGHRADAVTLEGLDPDLPQRPGINLEVHVQQIVDLLTARGDEVVLVGHSYAGSVISGAADQRPAQVRALLYLDAFVPEDGDSCWSMTNDAQREWYVSGSNKTGLSVEPLPFFSSLARPQPLGTFMQRSTLSGAHRTVPILTYGLAAAPEWVPHSPFVRIAEPLRRDPRWSVVDLDVTHNVLAKGTEAVRELILRHA